MRIAGDNSFLEIDRAELGPSSTLVDRDVLFNISVNVAGYSASDQAWVAEHDLDRFISDFSELEARRKGRAVLAGVSPEDLSLEFHSTDSVGHMAVKGHVGWNHPNGFLLQLRFGFHFEPDLLPSLLQFFSTIRE